MVALLGPGVDVLLVFICWSVLHKKSITLANSFASSWLCFCALLARHPLMGDKRWDSLCIIMAAVHLTQDQSFVIFSLWIKHTAASLSLCWEEAGSITICSISLVFVSQRDDGMSTTLK